MDDFLFYIGVVLIPVAAFLLSYLFVLADYYIPGAHEPPEPPTFIHKPTCDCSNKTQDDWCRICNPNIQSYETDTASSNNSSAS